MGKWSSRLAGAVTGFWPCRSGGKSPLEPSLGATSPGHAVDAFMASDIGCVRSSNQDSIAFVSPSDADVRRRLGVLAVVADGMGGHNGGEVASALAVETICRHYFAAQLSGQSDRYKIKLRSVGYRLVYEVRDKRLIVVVVAVGKRERNAVYKAAANR